MSGFLQGLCWRAKLVLPPDARVAGNVVKSALARLADACNDNGDGLWAVGKGVLADDLDVSEATVKRAINVLKWLRLIDYADGETGGAAGGRGRAAVFSIDVGRVIDLVPRERLPAKLRHLAGPDPDPRAGGGPVDNGGGYPRKGVTDDPVSAVDNSERGSPVTGKGVMEARKGFTRDPPTKNNINPHSHARAGRRVDNSAGGGGGRFDDPPRCDATGELLTASPAIHSADGGGGGAGARPRSGDGGNGTANGVRDPAASRAFARGEGGPIPASVRATLVARLGEGAVVSWFDGCALFVDGDGDARRAALVTPSDFFATEINSRFAGALRDVAEAIGVRRIEVRFEGGRDPRGIGDGRARA